MKKKPKIEIVKDYQPTKEEINKILDDFFEENKEWLEEIVKGLEDD